MRDNRVCNFDFLASNLDHGLLLGLDDDDHGAIYIPYSSLASGVYTLDTASITLAAGTLTADQITSTDNINATTAITAGVAFMLGAGTTSFAFDVSDEPIWIIGTGQTLFTITSWTSAITVDGAYVQMFNEDASASNRGDYNVYYGSTVTNLAGAEYTITSQKTGGGSIEVLNIDASGLTTLGGNLLVNGSITGTFVNITDDTNAYQINGEMILTNQGTQNISVGFKANITDPAAAIQNISIGSCAGEFLDNTAGVEATQNVFVGFEAGQGASAGTPNTGSSNVAIGHQALTAVTMGGSNVAIGVFAALSLTGGNNNFAIGRSALQSILTGSDNVGIGRDALLNATASRNIGIGTKAGGKELQGVDNIYIGHNAGGISSPTTKFFNVVIGSKAATSLGSNCNSNIIIGYQAATALTTGDGNVFVGEEAGQIFTTGGANVMLGFEQGKTANGIITGVGDSNLLAIGNQDPVTNLPLIEGYFAAHASGPKLLINGACNIGDGTNETRFELDGTLEFNGTATVFEDIIISLSSARVPAANAPTWSNFISNLNAFTYGLNDFQEFTSEIAHSYKEGSDIEIHVHGATNGLEGVDKTIKFEVEYELVDNNTAGDFGDAYTGTTILPGEITIPASTADKTAWAIDVGIDSTGVLLQGATLVGRVRRIASTGTEPASDPFVVQIGVHIEQDTVGSRTELTK